MKGKGKGKQIAGKAPVDKNKRGFDDDKTGGGRKRKNPGVIQFFEDEADDFDDSDDSEDSDFSDDSFEDEFETLSTTRNESSKGQSSLPFMPKVELVDEEEYDRMMEERFKDGSRFFPFTGDDFDDKPMEPNSFHPAAREPTPTIWKVKCTVGRERLSAFCLMQKFVHLKSLGTNLQIISAFAVDHMKGFVYIEAEKQCEINEACQGISGIYVTRVQPVPKSEVFHLFSFRSRNPEISVGMWARIKSGNYKGDLGQVMAVNDTRTKVTVKLIPRIDLQALAAKFGGGYSRQKIAVSAPRLISSSELEEFRPLIQIKRDRDTGKVFEVLDGMMLKDGYVYKKVSPDSLSLWGVVPTEEEQLKFGHSENNESNDLEWLSQIYGDKKKKRVIRAEKGDGKGESSSGSGVVNGFELYDLVCFRQKEFGVIIGMDKDDTYKILKESSEGPVAVTVEKRQIKSALLDLKLSARDHHGKTVLVEDHVRIVKGPSEGKQGIVRHIYRGIVFLYDGSEEENGGYFTAKANMCEKIKLAIGGGKDSEPGPLVFDDQPSSPRSPLSPEKPWQARENNREFNNGDKDGLFTIGQTLRIRIGPLKGYLCRVTGIRRSDVTVKLDSQQKFLTVKCEHLSEVQGKSTAMPTSGDPDSSLSKPFDFLGTEGSSGGWMDVAGTSTGGGGWNVGGGGPSTGGAGWNVGGTAAETTEGGGWNAGGGGGGTTTEGGGWNAAAAGGGGTSTGGREWNAGGGGSSTGDGAWNAGGTSTETAGGGGWKTGGTSAETTEGGGWNAGGGGKSTGGNGWNVGGKTTETTEAGGWNVGGGGTSTGGGGWKTGGTSAETTESGGWTAGGGGKSTGGNGWNVGGKSTETTESGGWTAGGGGKSTGGNGWNVGGKSTETTESGGWNVGGSGTSTGGGGWKTGGTSAETTEGGGWNAGGMPAERGARSNHSAPSCLMPESTSNPLSSKGNDPVSCPTVTGTEDTAWDTKNTSTQKSSWGAAVENNVITSDPDQSGGWGSIAGLKSGSSEGAKEDSNWGKMKSGSITMPEIQGSEGEKGGNWNSLSDNAGVNQGDGWAKKSNWKSGSTNDSIAKKSDSLSWGEGTLKNENQNSDWSSVGPSVATPDTDWGKKTEWNSGNGGSQASEVNKSNWNSGSGDSNQTSSWGKNSNWNSNNSSGSAWNENKNSNWSSGNPDPQTQDSAWGKKSNWNSGSGGANESTHWKSNGNWSTGSGDSLGGVNDGLNETSEDGGGGRRGGYRGRGGTDRGGFRGRGFRGGGFGGRGERGGFGGRGRSDREGFDGRWGSNGGFGGRGSGRVDQSGEDGSFDGKKGGWNKGASSNTTSWGQSNAADKGQSSSWNDSADGSWGKKNDASDKGGW